MADAEARLAEVSGDAAFARDFFARYIQGREVADYARLLAQAGSCCAMRPLGRHRGGMSGWRGDRGLCVCR